MVDELDAHHIDTATAARILNVTPARIRQLVGEGKLVSVRAGSGRDHRFRRSAVERLAGLRMTFDPRDLEPAQAPLPRVQDTVVPGVLRWGDITVGAHVRVFQGGAPEGTRTVIIVGRMTDDSDDGHGLPATAGKVITEHIAQQCLPRPDDALTAVWVLFEPTRRRELSAQTEFEALIFDIRGASRDAEECRRAPWWESRRSVAASPSSVQLAEPRTVPLAAGEVDALIGQPLEYYPSEAYRPPVIEEYLKVRQPIAYPYDSAHVGDLADYLSTFTRANRGVAEDLQERVVAHLADEIRTRSEYLDGLVWDDGTRRPDGVPAPTVVAARLERYRLSRTQWKLIENLAVAAPTWPWSEDVAAQAVRDMIALQDLAESVDRFAEAPDPVFERAARATAGILRHYVMADGYRRDPDGVGEGSEAKYPRKRRHASVFRVGEPAVWDVRYRESVCWDTDGEPGRVPVRDRNELRAILPAGPGGRHRFGVDLEGNQVAVVEEEGTLGVGRFAVLWPLLFGDIDLPAGTRLVADPGTGRRPVYLVDSDGGGIRPLPITRPENGWQFGYQGGDPGRLEASVAALVRRADGTATALIPRAVLEAAISYGNGDVALDLDLDKIRPDRRGQR